MSSIHVKPAPGRVIRAPDGQIIPPEGLHLVRDLYLDRRIAGGDLVVVSPAEPPAREAQTEKPKKGTDA